MKNEITTTYQTDIKWDLDGKTLQEAIEMLKEWAEDYGLDAKIDLYKEHYDNYENEIRIISTREETDQEEQARIDKAQKEFLDKQKRQEQSDLRAFEELRKKLGK